MAYRIPGGRVPLDLHGPTVEVERLVAPVTSYLVRAGIAGFLVAKDETARLTALNAIYERFVPEAQPTWDLIDHRGPILPTVGGMLRLDPLALGLPIVYAWLETMAVVEEEDEQSTAVDELIPPGELNQSLNEQLRELREAKAA